jgi:hypothetical protein
MHGGRPRLQFGHHAPARDTFLAFIDIPDPRARLDADSRALEARDCHADVDDRLGVQGGDEVLPICWMSSTWSPIASRSRNRSALNRRRHSSA